jgi:hypothetical protein
LSMYVSWLEGATCIYWWCLSMYMYICMYRGCLYYCTS